MFEKEKHVKPIVLAFVLSTLAATSAYAALPDPGMWVIGDELNGKPGRGLQIDRQGGKTVIVSYFGYRPDGSALFLQASGPIQDNENFVGDLVEYKNGRALSGAARDGEFAQSHGQIAISFDTNTSGLVTLPGESTQALNRFQFEESSSRLIGFEFVHASVAHTTGMSRTGKINFQLNNGQLNVQEQRNDGVSCTYVGTFLPAGKGFKSVGQAQCSDASALQPYRIEGLQVDERGLLSARIILPDDGRYTPVYRLNSIAGVCERKLNSPVFAVPGPRLRCSPTELGVEPEEWVR